VFVVKARHTHHQWVSVDIFEDDTSHVGECTSIEASESFVLIDFFDDLNGIYKKKLPAIHS